MSTHAAPALRISPPRRFFVYIILSLAMVAGLVFLLREGIATRFFSLSADSVESTFINGFILLILAVGIVLLLVELFNLNRQVKWLQQLQEHAATSHGHVNFGQMAELPNQLLAPVKSLFTDESGAGSLSTQSSKAVIDAISSRIDERRELSRWLIQTLIILGLIGTFWGLFGTITQIGQVIGALSTASGGSADAAQGFGDLIDNLQPVLSSMGVAFSSSLLGLAGSLLLAFLELQVGAAQNRFVEELEDWLYSITKLRSAFAFQADNADYDPATAAQQTLGMLETVATSMDRLRTSIIRGEEDRAITNRNIVALGERLRDLSERHAIDQSHLAMLSQNAANFGPVLDKLSQQIELMNTKSQTDRELADAMRSICDRDTSAEQLGYLRQDVGNLTDALAQQTENLRHLSDRDAQNVTSRLDTLGQVIGKAMHESAQMNAERVERAIQAASQED